MATNFLDELDITSTGDTVLEGFSKCQDNFAWLDDLFHGYARRPKFRWKDADEIYIGAGVWHHEGAVNQLLYCNSELTFKLGSAGSNSASDDLTATAWHYIYIDDSAVTTAGVKLLTETEFLNDTTAPTWSASKHGWYNSSDRCVFAVLTSGASAVLEFWHGGGDLVAHDAGHLCGKAAATAGDFTGQDIDATYTDVYANMPAFSTHANIYAEGTYGSASGRLVWRPNGSATAAGLPIIWLTGSVTGLGSCFDVITDSSGIFEIKYTAGTDTFTVYTHGWYFPEGM